MKALPAQKDRHAEFELELLDAVGQAWLRDVAPFGGPPEVLLLGNSHEILELPQKHRLPPRAGMSYVWWRNALLRMVGHIRNFGKMSL